MAQTNASEWHDARQRGERLPEHVIRCDLCPNPVNVGPFTHAVFDATDRFLCTECVEAHLESQLL